MTIKFVCGCGKHLRARDSMALQRAICPECGSMVGMPSLKPAHPAPPPPMTPQERLQHARAHPRPPEVAPPEPGEPPGQPVKRGPVRLSSGRGKTRPDQAGQHLEKRWYECLAYPL